MTYSIDEIVSMTGAERHGFCPAGISWLLTDSRSLCFPAETLFFALKTKRNDGHNYIRELYKSENGLLTYTLYTRFKMSAVDMVLFVNHYLEKDKYILQDQKHRNHQS